MSPFTATIARIKEKLVQVRNRGCECFGSQKHKFRLNPPLSEDEVLRFEREHGVTLPADYREFLLTVGNGGAGPYYGILPLEKWNDAMMEDIPRFLSRPSILRPEMEQMDEEHDPLPCPLEERDQGTLALCEQGCMYYALLVVMGPFRGRVVYVSPDNWYGIYFVRHPDFLSWYERWLDELLWGYSDGWFGFGHPGSPDQLIEVIKQSPDPALRVEALQTLSRAPALPEDSVECVSALLEDPSAEVRRRALYLIRKNRLTELLPKAQALLVDSEAEVRKAAFSALTHLSERRQFEIARETLRHDDEALVLEALDCLEHAKQLRRTDLVPLLSAPRASIRDAARSAWKSAVNDEPPDVSTLLDVSDEQVRRLAILNAGPADLDKLIERLERETEVELVRCLLGRLASFKDRRVTPHLIQMTCHTDTDVRRAAVRALGALGDRSAVPALERLLAKDDDPDRTVAYVARQALHQLRPWWRRLFLRRDDS